MEQMGQGWEQKEQMGQGQEQKEQMGQGHGQDHIPTGQWSRFFFFDFDFDIKQTFNQIK
jgi:hypothetical protein